MIVIVTERTAWFQRLAVRFHANGIYFYLCHPENAEFYCREKDTGGVILDCIPTLEVGERLCRILHETYPEMPIAAIVPPKSIPNMPAIRIFREGVPTDALFSDMLDFTRTNCGMRTERLSTFSLLVVRDRLKTQYMGYLMPLSVQEHKILRFLFYRAPRPTSIDDIAQICYVDGKQRVENVSVMIARINRHAAEIDPRPLIVNEYGKGYRLRDGILKY
jgi:hypothetical protein